jgi:dTDP-glucose 4,6-dehydratase
MDLSLHKYKGRSVFVTGAAGFIGSHLVESLLGAGAHVRALVRYNSFGRNGWLDQSEIVKSHKRDLEIIAGDVRDARLMAELTKETTIGFHLASLIAIPYSYRAPESYVQTNVLGALNVLEACRQAGIERLIHVSTSEVYGTARYTPIDENHPIQPQSPYSATKNAADALAYSYHCSFNLPVTIVRPFNTFGPRQSPRAVIPAIISQVLSKKDGESLELGDTSTVRDFTYVADSTRGMMLAGIAENVVGKTINLGTRSSVSIGETLNLILDLTQRKLTHQTAPERLRPKGSEVYVLQSDNRLANALLGWTPEISLREGLKKTIEWWQANPNAYRETGYVI